MGHKNFLKVNLIFIFIFLNIWDFFAAREILNGMVLGIFIFGPIAFLWFISTIKAIAAATMLSILESILLFVFVIEGLQVGIVGLSAKSLFWVPYLSMALLNGFWGLSIYSEYREKRIKRSAKVGAR